jgi:dihydroflavonol-4-reductase
MILVSGAAGFLGTLLVRRLVQGGEDVVAVARGPAPSEFRSHPRVMWVTRDIAQDGLDLVSLPDVDAVFHLAGATLGAGEDELLFFRANEATTVRMLQAFAGRTGRFIFASSQVVYGNPKHLNVTEDFILQPGCSAYACSKVNSENWIRWFQGHYGGTYFILRFSGFIDGGGIVDYLIQQALSGEAIKLYSQGVIRRDYLSSSEAVDVMIAALDSPITEGVLPINIGSGQAISAIDLARLVCEEVGSTSRIELLDNPSPLEDFAFCIDRAREVFKFNPLRLSDAVRQYVRYQKKYWSGNDS